MANRRQFLQTLPAAGATLATAGQLASAEAAAPTAAPASAKELARTAFERRAIEAMVWGMPAVNLDLMYQAMLRETKARANQMLYWSALLDWKNQTLTPNTDVVYLTPYYDTKDGPVVLEIPPADDGIINGTLMDAWQMPLEDVGPAGVDRGRGGKYLILPPGHKEPVPLGFIPLQSLTYKGYALLRSILRSGSPTDLAKAVEYGKRIKIYALSQAASPPPTVFVDAAGVFYDATIPYDNRFYDSLDRVVQIEPWLQRDRAMIDKLKTLGIEKGKRFAPDAATRQALDAAAAQAHALLDYRFVELFKTYFAPGSRWAFPASPEFAEAAQSGYADPDVYPIDDRGLLFTYIFFTPKRLGEGQFYLMVIDDKAGAVLDGSRNYRLNVPADAPVRQYWSATVYDRATHALIRKMSHAGRSSQSPGLQKNADGSVDLYFGPKAPAGKEANWVATDAAGKFEVLFRFYGPTKALFDKTWVLPDIVEVK
ncbi:DUF1214 domain-containing protein [Rivibacter subsaxonicus]|uniref:Secreted protein n=1 Tax=Rivibacter subsaxonicus TaxID=457575 RepID=A0A4Q7VNS0_9BURK|nr:DUF1254 domain-containing protein [Rivibacter subsaxonicus]RZT97864.1 hypothetical protein EV670_2264 [Rivibacter subsaxonicus]